MLELHYPMIQFLIKFIITKNDKGNNIGPHIADTKLIMCCACTTVAGKSKRQNFIRDSHSYQTIFKG